MDEVTEREVDGTKYVLRRHSREFVSSNSACSGCVALNDLTLCGRLPCSVHTYWEEVKNEQH